MSLAIENVRTQSGWLHVVTKDGAPIVPLRVFLDEARAALVRDILEYADAAPGQAHTPVGCYPLVATLNNGEVLCSKCVQFSLEDCLLEDDLYKITSVDVYWEGPPMVCDQCGRQMPAAYEVP